MDEKLSQLLWGMYRRTKGEREAARADAVKVAEECRELQAQLEAMLNNVLRHFIWQNRYEQERNALEVEVQACAEDAETMQNEYRKLQAELDFSHGTNKNLTLQLDSLTGMYNSLQAELDECKKEMWRRGHCGYNGENLQQQIDALQAELKQVTTCNTAHASEAHSANIERGKMQKELAAMHQRLVEIDKRRCETCKSFHAATYDCRTEPVPLSCVMNDYDGWKAKS